MIISTGAGTEEVRIFSFCTGLPTALYQRAFPWLNVEDGCCRAGRAVRVCNSIVRRGQGHALVRSLEAGEEGGWIIDTLGDVA